MHSNKFLAVLALVVAAVVSAPSSVQADVVYATDQGHTEVIFGWSHSGVSQQHGEFTSAKGTLKLADEIENSMLEVTIDASSVSTGVEALDKHLKSKDFLEVETYPEITFKSTSVKQTGDQTFDVSGDLTLHGVTRPVVFKAEMTHQGKHPVGAFMDYYKGSWIAFRATTEIDHQAFKVGSFSTGPIAIEVNTEMKAK